VDKWAWKRRSSLVESADCKGLRPIGLVDKPRWVRVDKIRNPACRVASNSGGWRLAAGGWRLAAGGWRLAAGSLGDFPAIALGAQLLVI